MKAAMGVNVVKASPAYAVSPKAVPSDKTTTTTMENPSKALPSTKSSLPSVKAAYIIIVQSASPCHAMR